ncbi:D-alanyl-D-alanine carboxypeptidase/D-alanyl-D-alanine endopeptidase [Gemmatimonas groenlandica]|uniref:D-alanyl-D-alanine carboxypeptidase/D-alanyl-D-alanine-endopeptidase n=1 Tax=Gemmatimonas groenlandica TaxID=2732249 RepID=A0A6M4IKM1_9BACT|nr:D-alanyl-D-alanine carboxypeptidase/D-alanyl-D-alanine-endopeptidase [Gemmatimonas groenlandica]QJR34409.1 D-alanyl-D-alanine carboxypeptidase/D-alanyl-D-alanine-endopeptidase [Gemmatimonas groenlandica]
MMVPSRLGVTVLSLTFGAALAAGCARGPTTSMVGPRAEPSAPIMMPAAVVPAPTTQGILQGIVDSVLAAPMWRNARWGLLIVDAERGDTILSNDADRLFMPASNEKLLTGAIALQTLGPDHRWRTPVLLHGRQRGTTWQGDVLVSGSGDPGVSDSLSGGSAMNAFVPIRDALAARGIARISGRVRAVGDAFPGMTTGFGWAYDDFDAAYSAAVDELMFNEGVLVLKARASTRVGGAVMVTSAPTRAYPRLLVQATTRDSVASATGGTRPPRLEAVYDSIGDRVVVSGTLAMGDSASITLSYRHPNDAYVAALTQSLSDAGVQVIGRALARADTLGRAADTVVVLQSAPLSAVLRRMQKPSQNQIAELLFRTSGLRASGDGSADSARAVGVRTLAGWGITSADAAYRDGSGLSRHDYVTPRAIVKVLDAMRRSPWFTTYRDALPIAGVDGTIGNRMKGTPAAGNARAKTGTVDKARSLSGYVTTADGRLIMFSMLSNNFTVPTREVERVQDLLVTTLAGRTLGGIAPRVER